MNARPPQPKSETEVERLRRENANLQATVDLYKNVATKIASTVTQTNYLYAGYVIEYRSVSQAFADILKLTRPDVYEDFRTDWNWDRVHKAWFGEGD